MDKLIIRLKEIAIKSEFSCGWMRDETIDLVCSLLMYYKPDLVIHTGFLWGKSSKLILDTLKNLSLDYEPNKEIRRDEDFNKFVDNHTPAAKVGRLIAIDPNMFNLDIDNLVSSLRNNYTNFAFYNMTSQEFFKNVSLTMKPTFTKLAGVIDGDHTLEGCRNDLQELHKLGASIMFVDDTIWLPYLNDLCKDFAAKNDYSYINFALYSGLGVLVRNV